jgi:3-oxoacyl-[acyl-carrier-protein] synthase II
MTSSNADGDQWSGRGVSMSDGVNMVITGLGVIAPGVEAPAQALRPAVPPEPGWFDVGRALPGRGYKRLPSGSQYLLAAARAALQDAGDCLEGVHPDRRGVVVGTNNACAPVLDTMDHIIMAEGAGALSPTMAPFMAMSLFASRLSVEHTLRAFNLTANSPGTAGLEALGIGARALAAGRAGVLMLGAVEEAPSSPLPWGGADVGAVVLIGESAAAAAARHAWVYGTCRVRSAFVDPEDVSAAPQILNDLWVAAVGDDPPPAHVDSVLDDSKVAAAVGAWLMERPGADGAVSLTVPTDAGSLTPLRRVVGLLAAGIEGTPPRAVLTASAQGNLALVVLTAAAAGTGLERS